MYISIHISILSNHRILVCSIKSMHIYTCRSQNPESLSSQYKVNIHYFYFQTLDSFKWSTQWWILIWINFLRTKWGRQYFIRVAFVPVKRFPWFGIYSSTLCSHFFFSVNFDGIFLKKKASSFVIRCSILKPLCASWTTSKASKSVNLANYKSGQFELETSVLVSLS